ncbi:hypothetical protein OEA41_009127 [Lepraria neglecta]|uniref:Uncharacterized protein n=1 Tax=Lepraria neglecta TaxID=209136 RepID=A0AAD9Z324_9LECA|nr:hypothetical protein OEA41_009127 [Lepraria neglecta]
MPLSPIHLYLTYPPQVSVEYVYTNIPSLSPKRVLGYRVLDRMDQARNNTLTKGDGDPAMAAAAEPEFYNLTLALDPMLNALMNATCNIELTTESSVYDKLFVPKDDREGFYFWYHILVNNMDLLLDDDSAEREELHEDERVVPLFEILQSFIESPVKERGDACEEFQSLGSLREGMELEMGRQVVFGVDEEL